MKEKSVIALTSFTFGVISNKILIIPALLLVLSNVIDYVTALIAVKMQGKQWDSSVGVKGIFKKVLMWLLVVVGVIFDELIVYASEAVGIKSPFAFLVSSVVAIWLVCNELISILENIKTCGIALPPFLEPLIKATKEDVEDKVKNGGQNDGGKQD